METVDVKPIIIEQNPGQTDEDPRLRVIEEELSQDAQEFLHTVEQCTFVFSMILYAVSAYILIF